MISIKHFLNLIRLAQSSLRGSTIGDNTEICSRALIIKSDIGKYCYIGMGSYLNHVKMGNYCSIAGDVTIGAMEHSHWALSTSTHLSDEGYDNKATIIGHDVWIGAQCVIRQGVTIGDGAVIGANSFVNKDIPRYAIAFGSPAKVYKFRFEQDVIDKIDRTSYWEKIPKEAREMLQNLNNLK